jgi:hypothetical protein
MCLTRRLVLRREQPHLRTAAPIHRTAATVEGGDDTATTSCEATISATTGAPFLDPNARNEPGAPVQAPAAEPRQTRSRTPPARGSRLPFPSVRSIRLAWWSTGRGVA